MYTYLISGIVFGLSAGLSPGPLQTLVITQSLHYGKKEGFKVAIAPLLTDIIIIILSLLLLKQLESYQPVLGCISFLGGGFLTYLGLESVRFKGSAIHFDLHPPNSIRKGIIANILNPSPYLFWLTIGAPLMIRAWKHHVLAAVFFLILLYSLLVGSKMALAYITDRSRNFFKSRGYIWAIRFLGVLLLIYALLFFRKGFNFLHIF